MLPRNQRELGRVFDSDSLGQQVQVGRKTTPPDTNTRTLHKVQILGRPIKKLVVLLQAEWLATYLGRLNTLDAFQLLLYSTNYIVNILMLI